MHYRGAVRAFAHDDVTYPLPEGHRFPLGRYRRLRERVERWPGVEVRPSRAATGAELLHAHTPAYLARAVAGDLSPRERAALGLPWSPELVERARRSVGATLQAADVALRHGVAANLGGGTHHAFPDAGRGFCMFNDVVCAVRTLRAAGRVGHVLVVDLDVHQGDGTHAALAGSEQATCLSVNGGRNYPFRRVPGDLEADLADGTGDDAYLDVVADLLDRALRRARPDLCIYLAGADPYRGDRLGRLALTRPGLRARDVLVRDTMAACGVPVCVTLAGGYADPISDTVDINAATLAVFARLDPAAVGGTGTEDAAAPVP